MEDWNDGGIEERMFFWTHYSTPPLLRLFGLQREESDG
jgi:hypothetical protein